MRSWILLPGALVLTACSSQSTDWTYVYGEPLARFMAYRTVSPSKGRPLWFFFTLFIGYYNLPLRIQELVSHRKAPLCDQDTTGFDCFVSTFSVGMRSWLAEPRKGRLRGRRPPLSFGQLPYSECVFYM
ncbi:hypothetical protein V8C26DRAFT_317492 [Trichoderma gracile]